MTPDPTPIPSSGITKDEHDELVAAKGRPLTQGPIRRRRQVDDTAARDAWTAWRRPVVSGDELRDAIAEVAWASRPRPGGAAYQHGGMSTADAVLTMPEMEAIKVVLWHHYAHWDGSNPRPEDMMPDLPESVINWVLGGPS